MNDDFENLEMLHQLDTSGESRIRYTGERF